MPHCCLSFDVRVDPGSESTPWTLNRRELYLLRPELLTPLSVDRTVWPAPESYLAPEWGPLEPFVPNLALLQGSLLGGGVRVCITLPVSGVHQPNGVAWQAALGSAKPSQPSTTWHFLGYDVADESFVSALMNCGYPDREVARRARAEWATCLNSNHLFDDAESAKAFTLEADKRIREHAPFFVLGLWSIPEQC